ncbi:polyprenyl synthetase family protein [Lacisediminimonas profundi]|uniref:polyprenyl synthetase family protein n=1 Tax=Lacisediminimonas profundi TaxID=2603856 RepID=UPI001F5038E9|nr:farnesyl diphosphate synthase [Lacisediminimonas profundi]
MRQDKRQDETQDDFAGWAGLVQAQMEEALDSFLPQPGQVPSSLHEAMRYAVLDGGKRVRPLLVFAAGELVKAPPAALASAAAAVEMIHAYSLVHDDMPCMDDDELRRGKPTVHVKFGEAMALLAGDALQAQAFMVLAGGAGSAPNRLAMVSLLASAAGSAGMCGGQAIDLASVGVALSLPELEQMHRLKTGALLRASVLLGALCGSDSLGGPERAALEAYSNAVGLAFQVVDDVLDATADSQTLGKTAGKDAQDNKPTYVSMLGLEQSRALAAQLRNEAHAAVAMWGEDAIRLRQLADLIVHRKA